AEEARIDGLLQARRPVILILGKDDLRPSLPPQEDPVHYAAARFPQVPTLTWSERQEADLARLRQTLIDHIEKDQVPASPDQTEDRLVEEKEGQALLTHARHKSAIDRAIQLVDKAREDLARQRSFDLVAISLKEALTELSAITGDDVSETLIEEIFNRFCIGK
ncbi:MAG: hypothetical protein GX849_00595, partial [Clostridiaceae bacterium]|nr:hypothetical protein [Clostridiaceae bacterium]